MSDADGGTEQDGEEWLRVVEEDVVLPGGRRIRLGVVRHPGASAIVPFLADDEVLLIQQFRHAAGGTIWEIPAGKLDPGETPRDCAARELEEETGYRAGELLGLGSILTTPGFTDERIHLFEATQLEATTSQLDADEIIEPIRMSLGAALDLIWSGQMVDGKSIVALLKAAHRRGRLGGNQS